MWQLFGICKYRAWKIRVGTLHDYSVRTLVVRQGENITSLRSIALVFLV